MVSRNDVSQRSIDLDPASNHKLTSQPRGTDVFSGEGLRATRVGLQFPDQVLTFAHWQQIGVRISSRVDSTAWYLGDWLAYGESQYRDRYQRAVEMVGLNYQTLRNYAWVARRFAMSRRRDTLTFYHHMEVARLPTDEQDRWLERAIEHRWSVHELRKHLKQEQRTGRKDQATTGVLPKISADRQRLDRWRAAAQRTNSPFEHWVVASLDAMANQALGDQTQEDDDDDRLSFAQAPSPLRCAEG